MLFPTQNILHKLGLALLVVGLCSTVSAATLYKWKDDQGIIHYSERPPAGVKDYEKVRSNATPGNAPVDYKVETPDASEEGSSNQANNQAASPVDQERCANARKNLEALNSFARIRVKEADGSVRFLSADEIIERRKEFQDVLNNGCN